MSRDAAVAALRNVLSGAGAARAGQEATAILAALEANGWTLAPVDYVARLTTALRVASHSPHDQDGGTDHGFPVCSVCGAIQTGTLAPAVSPDVAVADHDDLVSLDALVTRLHGWDLPDTAELLRRVIEEVALSRTLAPAARPEPPVAGTVAAIMAAGASYDVAMRAAELLAPAASEFDVERLARAMHFEETHTRIDHPWIEQDGCLYRAKRIAAEYDRLATPPDPPT